MSSVKNIHPKDLFNLSNEQSEICVIDVREEDEYENLHWNRADNWPLSCFDPQEIIQKYGLKKSQDIYFICRSGARSGRAASILANLGFSNTYNVTGGMLEWQASGLPIQK